MHAEIIRTVEEHTYNRYPTTFSDLVRLALLVHNGGLYMDISSLLGGDVSWLWSITKMPTQFIFNRYGERPSMVTMFYLFSGGPGKWEVDAQYNTKTFRRTGL